jgi:hypothetical protein
MTSLEGSHCGMYMHVHSSQADKNMTMKTLTECHSVIDWPIRLAPRVNNHDGDHDSGECGQPHSHPPGHTHACDQLLSGSAFCAVCSVLNG